MPGWGRDVSLSTLGEDETLREVRKVRCTHLPPRGDQITEELPWRHTGRGDKSVSTTWGSETYGSNSFVTAI